MYKVFVYGTLKTGYSNYHLLRNAKGYPAVAPKINLHAGSFFQFAVRGQRQAINYYKDGFIQQINALFADSKKRIDFDKNNTLIFKLLDNDKSISVYKLSSGEKQILIILLKVLIQENKPSIILMDEPEVSLHLAWQLDLIEMIQNFNENCQIIIVTHSAGLFNKGWKDKITKIEQIKEISNSTTRSPD